MATGFIYIINSLGKDYEQQYFRNVPTFFENRLYFGPCKIPMRQNMKPGDYIFGISPARLSPRRIVFLAQIDERITFADAYKRFPPLRGSNGPNDKNGPIHVEPVEPTDNSKNFPESHYRHIQGAMHTKKWKADLRSEELDAFFVCKESDGILGKWLGANGPELNENIMKILKNSSLHGKCRDLSTKNLEATIEYPIRHGNLFTGLHLETTEYKELVKLCRELSPSVLASSEDQVPETKQKKMGRPNKRSCC